MADCTKVRHPSRWAAVRALDAITRNAGTDRDKVPVALYPCQSCGSWHLTSKKLSGKPRRWEVLAR